MYKSIWICLLILCGIEWSPAQQNITLSPVVREFVKVESPVIALTHVGVIDGTGSPTRRDQTLIISGGKIHAIGDSTTTTIPGVAKVMEFSGYTVIPGLVGMRDHMLTRSPSILPDDRAVSELGHFNQQSSYTFPRLYLAAGVTTLRTTASIEPYADLNLKAWIDAGEFPGPKMHVTGPYLEGTGNVRLPAHELTGRRTPARLWNFRRIRV